MKVYGIKFNDKGKIYNFKSESIECPINVTVIVETEKGLQFGKVVSEIQNINNYENLKDIVQASSNTNIKEFENMRNRLSDMEKDIENIKIELKKETTDKELNQFRDIKSIVLKWGLTIALGAIAVYFGIKQ